MQAVIDCGAQSSIIPGELFECICTHMKANGHGCPEQAHPTVKLFGKGGKNDSELRISTMTFLELSLDGLTVKTPMFVQPSG